MGWKNYVLSLYYLSVYTFMYVFMDCTLDIVWKHVCYCHKGLCWVSLTVKCRTWLPPFFPISTLNNDEVLTWPVCAGWKRFPQGRFLWGCGRGWGCWRWPAGRRCPREYPLNCCSSSPGPPGSPGNPGLSEDGGGNKVEVKHHPNWSQEEIRTNNNNKVERSVC